MPEEKTEVLEATDGDILTFLFTIVTGAAAEIAELPTRMETWLLSRGFVLPPDPKDPGALKKADTPAFRARIYRLLAFCGAFGLAIVLWSMVLGKASSDPEAFYQRYWAGVILYGAVWFFVLMRTLYKVSPGLFWGVTAISLLLMGIAGDSQVSQISSVCPDAQQIIHSVTGDFKFDPAHPRPILELEMAARAWALFGFVVGMLMMIPFLAFGTISQALIGMVFGAPEKVAELVRRIGGEEHAEQVQLALKELRRRNESHLTKLNMWVLFLALITFVCCVIPTFYGLMFGVAIGLTTIITISSRIGFGVSGHELSHWVHSATCAVCIGSIAMYIIYVSYNCYLMGPVVYVPCGILLLALFCLMPILVRSTNFKVEREERRSGDADWLPYMLRATGGRAANGDMNSEPVASGVSQTRTEHHSSSGSDTTTTRRSFVSFGWIGTPFGVLTLLTIGWVVYTQFLRYPNPLAGLFYDPLNILWVTLAGMAVLYIWPKKA